MTTFKGNKKMLYIALSDHLSEKNREKSITFKPTVSRSSRSSRMMTIISTEDINSCVLDQTVENNTNYLQ
jgi:hypothetical protein